jgi:hypothetical protein
MLPNNPVGPGEDGVGVELVGGPDGVADDGDAATNVRVALLVGGEPDVQALSKARVTTTITHRRIGRAYRCRNDL